MSNQENVIIVGSGPAGLTAALYTARANLNPLLITGNEIGGQVSITNEVENYPGFPEGTTGPELVQLMQKQAERFGARIEINEVIEVDLIQGSPFRLKTHSQEYEAKAVVVCTGATPRRLDVLGEEEMIGKGVSFCATCDGFFFRGKDVVVVGGGDSALEEGLFLTRFAISAHIFLSCLSETSPHAWRTVFAPAILLIPLLPTPFFSAMAARKSRSTDDLL